MARFHDILKLSKRFLASGWRRRLARQDIYQWYGISKQSGFGQRWSMTLLPKSVCQIKVSLSNNKRSYHTRNGNQKEERERYNNRNYYYYDYYVNGLYGAISILSVISLILFYKHYNINFIKTIGIKNVVAESDKPIFAANLDKPTHLLEFKLSSSIGSDDEAVISKLKGRQHRIFGLIDGELNVVDGRNIKTQVKMAQLRAKTLAKDMIANGYDLSNEKVVIYVHGYGPDQFGDDGYSTERTKDKIDATFDQGTNGNVFTMNLTYDSWGFPWNVRHRTYDGILPYILAYLLIELNNYKWKEIDIIAHSMGNYVLCRTIELLITGQYDRYNKNENDNKFGNNNSVDSNVVNVGVTNKFGQFDFSKIQIVSCAAAIDLNRLDKTLDLLDEIDIKYKPIKWTSYYHKNDNVLAGWDAIDGNGGFLNIYMLGRDKITRNYQKDGTLMIQCIDCTNVILTEKVSKMLKHSYSFNNDDLLLDMRQLLADGILDPKDRIHDKTKINLIRQAGDRDHWKFMPVV